MRRLLAGSCGFAFLLPTIFFTWYTVRLVYVNLTMPGDETAVRMGRGMWVGFVAFPVIALTCGVISWFLLRRALRGFPHK